MQIELVVDNATKEVKVYVGYVLASAHKYNCTEKELINKIQTILNEKKGDSNVNKHLFL